MPIFRAGIIEGTEVCGIKRREFIGQDGSRVRLAGFGTGWM